MRDALPCKRRDSTAVCIRFPRSPIPQCSDLYAKRGTDGAKTFGPDLTYDQFSSRQGTLSGLRLLSSKFKPNKARDLNAGPQTKSCPSKPPDLMSIRPPPERGHLTDGPHV
ncbi:unnamed protein product [Pieris brassicae]|uniref:Uncharacterized protein n=1 Tax=Pieris brassicae TaxID=7116 RepID=A0A9P0TWW0_PIEBR|nr:unnamed protein product [Pieris brassicae]